MELEMTAEEFMAAVRAGKPITLDDVQAARWGIPYSFEKFAEDILANADAYRQDAKAIEDRWFEVLWRGKAARNKCHDVIDTLYDDAVAKLEEQHGAVLKAAAEAPEEAREEFYKNAAEDVPAYQQGLQALGEDKQRKYKLADAAYQEIFSGCFNAMRQDTAKLFYDMYSAQLAEK